jgi:enoyl-CoA hydratase/carnithine racemase
VDSYVRVDQDGPVATITLDRPDRLNAMGDAMDTQFWAALEDVNSRPDVRVIVWRGEGRAFSAGRDVNDLGVRSPGVSDFQYIAEGSRRTRELLIPPKLPIVVAIQGWCIGGSFERTLLCDLRIAADDAQFRLPELVHGLIPDSGGTARLFQMCGHGVVTDLVMTARAMDAQEALRLGVVSRVVPRDRLDEEAMSIAGVIAAMPPLAVQLHRQVVSSLGTATVDASFHEELLAQMLVYRSEDFAEFKAARAAKRAPKYRGT